MAGQVNGTALDRANSVFRRYSLSYEYGCYHFNKFVAPGNDNAWIKFCCIGKVLHFFL